MSDIPAYNVMAAPYNAAGDGVTDDTAAFNSAISDCNSAGGGIVYVPPGTYMIDADYGGGESIIMLSDVALVGAPGSILKAITNNLATYAVISGNDITNVLVRGLTILGERSTHTGGTGESGMGILWYQVTRSRIEDCNISDCWGDGIYLGSNNSGADPCEDIVVQNCILVNNRRNNMSVVGCHRGVALACKFEQANGTAPEAGIDIEPNFANEVEDFTVESCWSYDNAGFGYLVTGGAKSCKVVNCSSRADSGYGINVSSAIDTLIANNHVSDMTSAVRGAIDLANGSVRTVVRGNMLRNIQTGQAAIYIHSGAVNPVVQANYISLHNTVSPTGDCIHPNAPGTVVRGNYIKDTGGIGITVGSSATDTTIEGNYIEDAVGRGIYSQARADIRHNTIIDVASVSGAFIQQATGTGSTLIGNVCKLSTPNGSILPIRCDVAPALAIGNVQVGMQSSSLNYVGTDIRANVGDANITLTAEQGPAVIPYATNLTANRTVTLSGTRPYAGCYFRIVRTGLGAFTLNVGGLKTIPASTAAVVEVMYNGSAWQLIGYQLL